MHCPCSCFAALKFGGFLLCRSFSSTAPAFVRPCPDSAINKPCYVKILFTVNRNATLCYLGHKGDNKPSSERRRAAALQQKMGWSADCPCPCPAWAALALQPWSPPSQAVWQFLLPVHRSALLRATAMPESRPWCICFDASAGSGELLQQPSQQGQETRFVPALPGTGEVFFSARSGCSNLLLSKAVLEGKSLFIFSSFLPSDGSRTDLDLGCFPGQ